MPFPALWPFKKHPSCPPCSWQPFNMPAGLQAFQQIQQVACQCNYSVQHTSTFHPLQCTLDALWLWWKHERNHHREHETPPIMFMIKYINNETSAVKQEDEWMKNLSDLWEWSWLWLPHCEVRWLCHTALLLKCCTPPGSPPPTCKQRLMFKSIWRKLRGNTRRSQTASWAKKLLRVEYAVKEEKVRKIGTNYLLFIEKGQS